MQNRTLETQDFLQSVAVLSKKGGDDQVGTSGGQLARQNPMSLVCLNQRTKLFDPGAPVAPLHSNGDISFKLYGVRIVQTFLQLGERKYLFRFVRIVRVSKIIPFN